MPSLWGESVSVFTGHVTESSSWMIGPAKRWKIWCCWSQRQTTWNNPEQTKPNETWGRRRVREREKPDGLLKATARCADTKPINFYWLESRLPASLPTTWVRVQGGPSHMLSCQLPGKGVLVLFHILLASHWTSNCWLHRSALSHFSW